ncbi:hypothetical protein HYC85_028838 [Camellia sinensis]|uniref:Uncharacterized protein n=1 Tax=Camellia sinensis TaxID=4442 RepID=A0A7J7FX02_CAMSI|nr:hypothetical protein HYC85_028838 [Camellia sinensis]
MTSPPPFSSLTPHASVSLLSHASRLTLPSSLLLEHHRKGEFGALLASNWKGFKFTPIQGIRIQGLRVLIKNWIEGSNQNRELFQDLDPLLSNTFGTITALLQAVTSLCWQRSKLVLVNENNCTAETALLGGAVEDSLIMPDPLPSVTSSSLSTSITTAGSRNLGRSGPSIESSSMLATSSGFMLSSLHSSTTEETPLFGTLWTGGNLTRLHAPRNYNFKDDMKVFSPLVEVQPITPSLDKLWDQHEGAKKDHLRVDKKPSLLFPSSNRRFPLSEEGGGNDHPIFDWKPSSTSKQVYFLPLSNSLSILLNHLFAA